MPAKLPLPALFWLSVDVRSQDECWLWLESVDYDGYGLVYTKREDGGRTTIRAHAVAFTFANKRRPEQGMKVCHSCDNPPCCNPRHLWEGTQQDNMDDMVRKGRRVGRNSGEIHGHSKLTDAKVIQIRKLYATGSYTYVELAEKYGVAFTTIHKAVKGVTWGHIPMPKE